MKKYIKQDKIYMNTRIRFLRGDSSKTRRS